MQNIQSLSWDLDDVNSMLRKIMLKAFEEVVAISKENNVSLRIASYMLAIIRITTAAKLRGVPVSMD